MSDKDKKPKETSKKVNFDFSGISGRKTDKPTTKQKAKAKEVITGASEKLKGIMLTIKDENNKWYSKDIAECTGIEFERWAAGVFPAPMSIFGIETEHLEKLRNRMGVYRQILQYHTHSPFQVGKPDTNKEKKDQIN